VTIRRDEPSCVVASSVRTIGVRSVFLYAKAQPSESLPEMSTEYVPTGFCFRNIARASIRLPPTVRVSGVAYRMLVALRTLSGPAASVTVTE